jgi:cell division protein FtsL
MRDILFKTGTLANKIQLSSHWRASLQLILKAIVAIALVTIILMGYVWSRLLYLQQQTKLLSLTNDQRKLEQEIYQLKLKLATIKQPARLDRLAKEKWNLQIPTAQQIIVLEVSGD